MTTDGIHLLTGAYAVGALDDLERARFEAHLDVCPDCRLEVASLREAAALLTESTAIPPPAGLRARVLAEAATVRPLPPQVSSPRHSTGAPGRASRRRWFPALVVAAALALIAGIGAVWQPWSGPGDVGDEPERRLTAAERVIGAPDAEKVTLQVDGAEATVIRSKAEGRAVLVTKGMPPAPDGRVYELWLRDDSGHLTPAGLMPDGADHTLLLEGDASEATGVGITHEPEGGSEIPTRSPIALFEFSEAAT